MLNDKIYIAELFLEIKATYFPHKSKLRVDFIFCPFKSYSFSIFFYDLCLDQLIVHIEVQIRSNGYLFQN